jgi:hypothetical protein
MTGTPHMIILQKLKFSGVWEMVERLLILMQQYQTTVCCT